MTEQPDTAMIRNQLFWADGRPSQAAGDAIRELCDALDATRTERDRSVLTLANAERAAIARAEAAEARVELLETTWVNDGCWRHMEARAEAAEATLGLSRDAHAICCRERIEATDRAEDAEARIAAALDELVVSSDPDEYVEPYLVIKAVRRALTGGTA